MNAKMLRASEKAKRLSRSNSPGLESRTEERPANSKLTAKKARKLGTRAARLSPSPDPETKITNTGDPETRERFEIRSKTGIGDYLRAAASGGCGHWRERVG